MHRSSRVVFLGAALVASVCPSVAGAAPRPVTGVVPPVLVVSQPVRLTLAVPGTPRKVAALRVRVVLSPTTVASAGTLVGAITLHNVAAHRARRVALAVTVPANPPRTSGYLIACVRAGSAKERCVVLRRVAVSPDASASAGIEAERAAGLISTSTAIRRLAASMHAGGAGDDALERFRALWPLASAADRTFMMPMFLPPDTVGSAWARKGKKAASTPVRQRRDVDPCARFTVRDAAAWVEMPAAGGKVLFHFDPDEPAQTQTTFVSAMDTYIYTPLTTANGFHEPLGDGNETCAHGGDGRLDIFISSKITAGGGGFTNTYPPTLDDPCFEAPQPVFIALNPTFGVVALAHEFFHAVQMAYGYRKACAGKVPWFDEATAVWGEYLAYPGNHFTLHERPDSIRPRAGFHVSYDSWVFWYAMTKDHGGTKVVSGALAALEGAKPHTEPAAVKALDGALSGGLRKGLEDFAAHAWNQDPIGAPGFPITTDYAGWNIDSRHPAIPPAPTALKLAGATLKQVPLSWPGGLAFGDREYTNLTVPDANVRELRWTNGFAHEPGLDVQAYLHTSAGTWRVEDWSAKSTVTLCRDQPEDDVDRIILATTNADLAGLSYYTGFGRHADTMRLRRRCAFPTVYAGTWTRTIHSPSSGWTETITGDARFIREPLLPDIAEQLIPVPYNLDHASATWTVSGQSPGGGNICQISYSGNGTETVFNDADAYMATRLTLQDANPYLTAPTTSPFYYAIDVLGKRLHPPTYDINGMPTCGGGTTEPTWTDYLDIGLFQDANGGITPGDPLLEASATTRTLAGTRTYSDPSIGDNVITDTWSFTGFD